MINKPKMYWNNAIFADENKFNVLGSDSCIITWRKKNERLNPKNLIETVRHGGAGACQHQN